MLITTTALLLLLLLLLLLPKRYHYHYNYYHDYHCHYHYHSLPLPPLFSSLLLTFSRVGSAPLLEPPPLFWESLRNPNTSPVSPSRHVRSVPTPCERRRFYMFVANKCYWFYIGSYWFCMCCHELHIGINVSFEHVYYEDVYQVCQRFYKSYTLLDE